jgi:hypothetical protein
MGITFTVHTVQQLPGQHACNDVDWIKETKELVSRSIESFLQVYGLGQQDTLPMSYFHCLGAVKLQAVPVYAIHLQQSHQVCPHHPPEEAGDSLPSSLYNL